MAHQYRDSGSGDSSVGQANPGDLTLPPRGMRVVVLSIQHSGGHMGQQTHQAPWDEAKVVTPERIFEILCLDLFFPVVRRCRIESADQRLRRNK